MDNRITTLAENLVNYSCQVKPGDKVYVHYTGDSTRPLAKEIVKKVYEVGGVPFCAFYRSAASACTADALYQRTDGTDGGSGQPGNVSYGLLYCSTWQR